MGTGLGLSMIYGFARQSGGRVRIDSETGKGSTICIYRPRHEVEVAGDRPVSRMVGIVEAESAATIVVVDDEPTVRVLIADVSKDDGYEVIEARDGRSGLAALRSGRVDLLITGAAETKSGRWHANRIPVLSWPARFLGDDHA